MKKLLKLPKFHRKSVVLKKGGTKVFQFMRCSARWKAGATRELINTTLPLAKMRRLNRYSYIFTQPIYKESEYMKKVTGVVCFIVRIVSVRCSVQRGTSQCVNFKTRFQKPRFGLVHLFLSSALCTSNTLLSPRPIATVLIFLLSLSLVFFLTLA